MPNVRYPIRHDAHGPNLRSSICLGGDAESTGDASVNAEGDKTNNKD